MGKTAHAGTEEVYPQDRHGYKDGRGRHASFQAWMMSVEGAYIQAHLEGSRCARGPGGLTEARGAIGPCRRHSKREGRKEGGVRLGGGSCEKVQARWKESSSRRTLPEAAVAGSSL